MPPKRGLRHSPTSGLSWNEVILTTPSVPLSVQLHDILHKSVGIPPSLRSTAETREAGERGSNGVGKKGNNGVNTLETMAIRCLLNNLELLEEQSLEGLPEVLVRRVWGEVLRR
jgi:hypothetical protein